MFLTLCHCSKYITSFAKNLGVVFDSGLTFEKQVNAVVKSSFCSFATCLFFQQNTLNRLFIYLFFLVLITVTPYITVLASLVWSGYRWFKMLTGRRRFDHVTPILIFLNWLPVKYRIIFKVLTFVLNHYTIWPHSTLRSLFKLQSYQSLKIL